MTAEARAAEPRQAPQPHDETSLSAADDRIRQSVRSGGNDSVDIGVPGHSYSFGVVKAAQAQGDLEVLVERDRRALRVHLTNVDAGLEELSRAMDAALE